MTQVIEITTGATLEEVLTDSIPFVHNECIDPFQRHWNTPGVEHYQPCFMPSRSRKAQMKLLRLIRNSQQPVSVHQANCNAEIVRQGLTHEN